MAAAPDGRSWVLATSELQLVLHRPGEAPRELIPPGRYRWYDAGWSPDGKWVAVIADTVDRKMEGLLFSADGVQKPLKLGSFHTVDDQLHQPIRWMPDGRTFAFVGEETFLDSLRFASWVHVVDVTTGRERVWRLPYSGLKNPRDFQFVDEHTVLATLTDQTYQDRLYRYELR